MIEGVTMVSKRLMLIALPVLAMSASGIAQGPSDYVVVGAHIDQVENPTTIFQGAAECTNNDLCKAALSAISAASGVPVDKAVAVAAMLSTSKDGEGADNLVSLPDGYMYCSAQFHLTSIVPHDDERASTLLVEARQENGRGGVNVETWTPVQGMFGGRSWVEGDLTVVGVRSDLADSAYSMGTCHSVPNQRRAFLSCRGGGCEGTTVDVGHTVSTAPTGPNERRT
jgi:hypothetical protein